MANKGIGRGKGEERMSATASARAMVMGDGGDFGSGPRRQERRGLTAIDGMWYCAGTGSRRYRYLRPEGEHGPFWGARWKSSGAEEAHRGSRGRWPMRPPPTNTASARLRIRPPGSSRGPGSLCLALGLYRVHGDTVPTKCRSEAHTVHRPLMHPSTTSPIFPRHPFTQPSTSSARKVHTRTHALPRAHTRSTVSGSGGVKQGNAFGSERASTRPAPAPAPAAPDVPWLTA
ncbi:hypothetical protein EDB80DRAFT_773653 [Ilyonectria destructans]|nr:hypothetical protein EDB80DRAFT_773653 [Ilyonectria destructans]